MLEGSVKFGEKLPIVFYKYIYTYKGQLISKCLFGVLNSPKKRTKSIQLEVP